jgi:hypothetical protein
VIRRRLFAVASAISLLLFAVTVALWVRSLFVQDQIFRVHRVYVDYDTAITFQTTFVSANGSVGMTIGREYIGVPRRSADTEWPEAVEWSYESRSAFKYRTAYGTNALGFTVYNFGSEAVYERMWFVPIAPISITLAVLPLCWNIRRRRNIFRLANNLCLTCGYSLTGNTSGVCPECGTPVPHKVEANT